MSSERSASAARKTSETNIEITLGLDGNGQSRIDTGISFFNHMLNLWASHGLFNLDVEADGDIEVDYHHTVEDVGLVLGEALKRALGKKRGIRRYGHATVPMDEALAAVTIDLSGRPYLVFNVPINGRHGAVFDTLLAKEFFRAVASSAGITLHISLLYGENEHHIIEAVFKAFGRALDQAVSADARVPGVPSTKGVLT
jgi:imidazoleglycerol-phosphate dehydratase